jgi:fructose-1,6-bisphosphatase I
MTDDGSWQDFFTLESYIAYQQRLYPDSRGVFSDVLRRIAVATKIIASRVRRAGLVGVLGKQGGFNVQGEEQMKLDVISNMILKDAIAWLPSIAVVASEEDAEMTIMEHGDNGYKGDQYVVFFDPLDGSSNIDVNVSVGTIFSIHRAPYNPIKQRFVWSDFLKSGAEQVAAGYVIYGSSTMFVFTTGQGVHGFTLEPSIGEFTLSHENIRIPDRCSYFSANDTNYHSWPEPSQKFADTLRYTGTNRYARTSSRYVGSFVADAHRNLMVGGIYMYPESVNTGKGKLRLIYECAPLAMIYEQAGGLASTGRERIMDITPTELHQRSPIIIGTKKDVEYYEKLMQEGDKKGKESAG